jgi:hypothetical protein
MVTLQYGRHRATPGPWMTREPSMRSEWDLMEHPDPFLSKRIPQLRLGFTGQLAHQAWAVCHQGTYLSSSNPPNHVRFVRGSDSKSWKHNPDKFNRRLKIENTTKDILHPILQLSQRLGGYRCSNAKLGLTPPRVKPMTLAPSFMVALRKGPTHWFNNASMKNHDAIDESTSNWLSDSPRD